MNQYIQITRNYITEHKKESIVTGIVIIFVALIIGTFIYNTEPHYQYQPADACSIFTSLKAEDLLGNNVIDLGTNSPVVTGDTATSQCSYTDTNPDKTKMVEAAIAIRSAVDDKGILKNKTDFASSKPKMNVENVTGLGSSAYFNETLGQLNILEGRNWYILSFGVGASPQDNTLAKDTTLAHKVLP
jgi:hypothetical protein